MSDGKCPDIYECRLGVDKIFRESIKLRSELADLRRDRERLEWIMKKQRWMYQFEFDNAQGAAGTYIVMEGIRQLEPSQETTPRAAIDAAMRGEG